LLNELEARDSRQAPQVVGSSDKNQTSENSSMEQNTSNQQFYSKQPKLEHILRAILIPNGLVFGTTATFMHMLNVCQWLIEYSKHEEVIEEGKHCDECS